MGNPVKIVKSVGILFGDYTIHRHAVNTDSYTLTEEGQEETLLTCPVLMNEPKGGQIGASSFS